MKIHERRNFEREISLGITQTTYIISLTILLSPPYKRIVCVLLPLIDGVSMYADIALRQRKPGCLALLLTALRREK